MTTVRGQVVRGAGRGKALGAPTANLDVAEKGTIPIDGIYAAWATVRGERFLAAVSIGMNATFDATVRTVEAHILDFDAEIYGEVVTLELRDYLHPMQRFATIEELKNQIKEDILQTRALLAF